MEPSDRLALFEQEQARARTLFKVLSEEQRFCSVRVAMDLLRQCDRLLREQMLRATAQLVVALELCGLNPQEQRLDLTGVFSLDAAEFDDWLALRRLEIALDRPPGSLAPESVNAESR